jgi:hypothetical protein
MRLAMVAVVASVLAFAAHAIHAQDAKLRTVHVFVALADNQHQGIVPVAATLGNGEDAERNLYWVSLRGENVFFTLAGVGTAQLSSETEASDS